MGDNAELKVKSFRINEETAEKFRVIANEVGGNQQEVMAKLIEAYEFQKGKAVLIEKKAEIDQFEKYVSCLVGMYMRSLEDNQNITSTVRTEFESSLHSKDETIKDLQARWKEAREQKEEAIKKAEELEDKNKDLNKQILAMEEIHTEEVKELKNTIEDLKLDKLSNEEQSKTLITSYKTLMNQFDQMKADAEKSKELEQQLAKLQSEHDKLKDTHDKLQSDFSNQKTNHDKIIADMQKQENETIKRTKEQVKFDYENKILELKQKHQQELKEQQDNYLKQLNNYINSLSFSMANTTNKRKSKKQEQQEQENTNPLFDDLLKNGISDTTK